MKPDPLLDALKAGGKIDRDRRMLEHWDHLKWDTARIAEKFDLPEAFVANRLWQLREARRG